MSVIIGMDPHKRSATIEVLDELGDVLTTRKFGADQVGYAEMLAAGHRFTDRVWAVEGCNGVGRHIAHRLIHDGETVVDVPAKLSAQVRVFATGNGRKTDLLDAHSVGLAVLRTPNLVRLQPAPELVVMGMLVDRRDELGCARTQTVNRLHRLLLETIDKKTKAAERDLRELVIAAAARCSTCTASGRPVLRGCWPMSATSTGSATGTDSRPGTAPHCRTRLPVNSNDTACPVPITAGSTGPAHHRRRAASQPDRWTDLFRRRESRRQDVDGGGARPQASLIERHLRTDAR